MEIAIIVLSLLCGYFGYELIRKSYRLGELEQERKQHIVPEIDYLRQENKRLRNDVEKIIEGDKYITDIYKEKINNDKVFKKSLMESLRKDQNMHGSSK